MLIRPLRLVRRVVLFAAAGAVVSCGGGGGDKGTTTQPVVPVLTTINVILSVNSITVGGTASATAAGFDQNGAAMVLGTITWSTASPTIASITSSGLLTGVAVGATGVTATVGAKSGTGNLTVTAPAPVASVSVSPTSAAIFVGGTQQVIASMRDAANNVLSGRIVTWSSSASAIASVSTSGLITGVAAGSATITATSETKTATVAVTVTVPTASLTLASAGQSATFLTSPNFSQTLAVQAGQQYLIGVVNTNASYTQAESFSLTGIFSSTASVSASSIAAPRTAARVQGPSFEVGTQLRAKLKILRTAEANHIKMLERDGVRRAQMGNANAAWASTRALQGRQATKTSATVLVSQTIGTVNKVYVDKFSSNSCADADSIGARTVAVGQHVIVLADTSLVAWPNSYRPDSSFYQTFATEFDNVTWPHMLANIGDPLAYDTHLSSVGKITVVMTPKLNDLPQSAGGGSVVAFVSSCDFFPYATSGPEADLSNQTEMFYSWVPSATEFDVPSWGKLLRATAAHETKHIVSFASRILQNASSFETIWLEEGLAQESSEIWLRNFNQATWKGQANFQQTVACEINLGPNAPCDASGTLPLALAASHLPSLFDYLQGEGANSEGLGLDVPANYGAGWIFSRWVTDQYAGGSEATLVKAIIAEPNLTGLANLSAHTGQSAQTLLTFYNMATAIFQKAPTFTAADVRMTMPSFNLADIFNIGQTALTCGGVRCGLFTDSGSPEVPVIPIAVNSGSLANPVFNVPGTAASFFVLSATGNGIQSLQLIGSGGGTLSAGSGLRVAIIRVR